LFDEIGQLLAQISGGFTCSDPTEVIVNRQIMTLLNVRAALTLITYLLTT
jgi:hypothetical protein